MILLIKLKRFKCGTEQYKKREIMNWRIPPVQKIKTNTKKNSTNTKKITKIIKIKKNTIKKNKIQNKNFKFKKLNNIN